MRNVIVFMMGTAVLFGNLPDARSEIVAIDGRAIFSFSNDSIEVVSKNEILSLSKKELSASVLARLEQAQLENGAVAEFVDESSILLRRAYLPQRGQALAAKKIASQAAIDRGSFWEVRGQVVSLPSDAEVTVSAGQRFFRLSNIDETAFPYGKNVHVVVPKDEAFLSWSTEQDTGRSVASARMEGFERTADRKILIQGRSEFSAEPGISLARVADRYFRWKSGGESAAFPGEWITVEIPLEAMLSVWSIAEPGEVSTYQRLDLP